MMRRTTIAVGLMILGLGCQEAADVARWEQTSENPAVQEALPPPTGEALPAGHTDLAPPPTRLFVSDEYSEETPPPDGWSFQILDLWSLYFYIYFKDLPPGPHVARLDLYNPDGYRYTTLSAPFEVDEEVMAPMGTRVELELPVAGTNITKYFLTGVWSARVLVDVVAGPAEEVATFELYWAPNDNDL